jgi:hypothetical protein
MTRAERLAHLFGRSPGRWFDGRELAAVGGIYAWRTRISELRRSPHCLDIQNRQRTVRQPDGTAFVVSEYRLVVPSPAREAAPTWELTP